MPEARDGQPRAGTGDAHLSPTAGHQFRSHSATVGLMIGSFAAGFLLGSFRKRRRAIAVGHTAPHPLALSAPRAPVAGAAAPREQLALPAAPAEIAGGAATPVPAAPVTVAPSAATPVPAAPITSTPVLATPVTIPARPVPAVSGTDDDTGLAAQHRPRERAALAACLVSLCAVALLLVSGVGPTWLATVSAVGARGDHSLSQPVTTIVEQAPGSDCTRLRCVALTFDDGPDRYSTPALLDILEARGVAASFFVLGYAIEGNEDILHRMKRLGMAVENHTWNHPDLSALSAAGVQDQLARTDAEIVRVIGDTPRYMRPPYGAWTPGYTPTGGLRPVLWEVDPQDWLYRNSPVIAQNVVDQAGAGDVILLHDIHQTSVDAVPAIIDGLEARGFTFVLLDDIYAARPDCAVQFYCGPAPSTPTPSATTTVLPGPSTPSSTAVPGTTNVRVVAEGPA